MNKTTLTQCAPHTRLGHRQGGAILITVLAILITLTLLGIAATRSTTLEERMAGNFQEKYLAVQSAEAALRVAEAVLDDPDARALLPFDGTGGSYDVTNTDGSVNPFDVFEAAGPVTVSVHGVASGTAYVIEKLPPAVAPMSSLVVGFPQVQDEVQFYRVTARGYGKSGVTEVILQTTWAL